MNSRGRVLAVLNHKIPDRVPIFELLFHESIIKKINPDISYFDFYNQMGIDILVVGPDHEHEILDKKNEIYRNEWGVIRRQGPETVSVPIDGPIKEARDLKKYKPPDPTNLNRLRTLKKVVKDYKDKKMICLVIHDAFAIPWYLRGGIDRLLIDYYYNPKLAEDIAKIVVEYFVEFVKIAAKIGADMFLVGDDYAHTNNTLMSPKHFKKFILPGLSTIVSEIKKQGLYSIKHSDGNLMPIIDMIVSTGIDILNPIEPEAGMDIIKIKKKYGDKIVVCGNVDCKHLLVEASTNEVENYVKKLIKKVAPGGRFIISSSNSIHSSVKPENYLAMVKSIKKYGKYLI